MRGAVKEALAEHASMLPPDWKQDQAETSRLQRKTAQPTQGGDKGEAGDAQNQAYEITRHIIGYLEGNCGLSFFDVKQDDWDVLKNLVASLAAPQPTTAAGSLDRNELIALLQDLASVNLSREAVERQAARIADALIAQGISGNATVAWIAFAGNGNIRLWTSDEGRAKEEKAGGLDLRAFTLAELVALIAKLPAWQDIETAPRDGTRILATGGGLGPAVEIVSYIERVGAWETPNDTLDDRDDEPQGYSRPALWRPLPASSLPSTSRETPNG